MFNKKTVFVLGAGASWHYGYPTGEGLVMDVISCTKRLRDFCKNRLDRKVNLDKPPGFMVELHKDKSFLQPGDIWDETLNLSKDFIDRLKTVEPLVIDYFLGWNPHLQEIGRMMIAGALLERENKGAGNRNYNRWLEYREPNKSNFNEKTFPYGNYADNWIRYVIHQLLLECKAPKKLRDNKVHFLTFNYDCSIAVRLDSALKAVGFLSPDEVDEFLSGQRVTHMYGALSAPKNVRKPPPSVEQRTALAEIEWYENTFGYWHGSGKGLQVIDPDDKANGNASGQAEELLRSAERIYFLGFGFDQHNLKLLGFPRKSSPLQKQEILFTNFENALTINKRASRAFEAGNLGDPQKFHASGNFVDCEKSVRNTYDAIALDFGAFDD